VCGGGGNFLPLRCEWGTNSGAGESLVQVERRERGEKTLLAHSGLLTFSREENKKAGVADSVFPLPKVCAFSLLFASAPSLESQELVCLSRSSGKREKIGRESRVEEKEKGAFSFLIGGGERKTR
jgi:hypothetical protein